MCVQKSESETIRDFTHNSSIHLHRKCNAHGKPLENWRKEGDSI